ncbi:MAG: phage shock protein operon transcriptional activator [Halioglobus sp.]
MERPQESMIGNSAALAEALDHISNIASINRPVLILGERGTGKELAAERLHFLSERWDSPLIKVNCAAIAETLLESELFGHEPGSFTGATRTHRGRFERADGGTLFLDELATMSNRLQEKLLRLVEYGEFERLGGQETLRVDVRIVAATNSNLPSLARAGEFREDLLDRLSFDVIHLPSLTQRKEDLPELALHFAIQMCGELGWKLFPGFTPAAQQQLEDHGWPGNIRELKNVVERSIYRWGKPDIPVGQIVIDPFKSPYCDGTETTEEAAGDENVMTPIEVQAQPLDFHQRIAVLERQLIEEALAKNGHNQRHTADALGLRYDQLRGLIRKYKLSGGP